LRQRLGVQLQETSLFDVQAKRLHEYKRQLLNVLHVVALYQEIKTRPGSRVPRTVIFAGKAAPGYEAAKQIIRLIHDVANVVNHDPASCDLLRVVFIPNYGVSVAEVLIPGTDLSEQISTAGMEASGTGNMKFALNGALTIGTLDGANVEIRDAVGAENFFLFGLTEPALTAWRVRGYDPTQPYRDDVALMAALDAIGSGVFSPGDPGRYRSIVDRLLYQGDPYFLLADFHSYRQAQLEVDVVYRDPESWTRKSILNVAAMGRFSSDATIRGYAQGIWRVPV
jgi:starch phosphorylase